MKRLCIILGVVLMSCASVVRRDGYFEKEFREADRAFKEVWSYEEGKLYEGIITRIVQR